MKTEKILLAKEIMENKENRIELVKKGNLYGFNSLLNTAIGGLIEVNDEGTIIIDYEEICKITAITEVIETQSDDCACQYTITIFRKNIDHVILIRYNNHTKEIDIQRGW